MGSGLYVKYKNPFIFYYWLLECVLMSCILFPNAS